MSYIEHISKFYYKYNLTLKNTFHGGFDFQSGHAMNS